MTILTIRITTWSFKRYKKSITVQIIPENERTKYGLTILCEPLLEIREKYFYEQLLMGPFT